MCADVFHVATQAQSACDRQPERSRTVVIAVDAGRTPDTLPGLPLPVPAAYLR